MDRSNRMEECAAACTRGTPACLKWCSAFGASSVSATLHGVRRGDLWLLVPDVASVVGAAGLPLNLGTTSTMREESHSMLQRALKGRNLD